MADKKKAKDNTRVKQWLKERIKRNEDIGLFSSPENIEVQYDDELNALYGPNVPGGVRSGTTKIQLNPDSGIKNDEFLEKYVIAHELEHANKKKPFISGGDGEHERTRREVYNNPAEDRRKARSIMQPAFVVGDFLDPYEDGKMTNMPELLKKYAKEAGVPLDEIIDSMVMNARLGSDKDVEAAHDQTKANMKKGRGISGELFEKKMSPEEAYKPWEELKKRIPKRKK